MLCLWQQLQTYHVVNLRIDIDGILNNCHSRPFAIDRLQDRGKFFIDPGEQVYIGQVLGEHSRDNDLEINVIKGKKLTRHGSDVL